MPPTTTLKRIYRWKVNNPGNIPRWAKHTYTAWSFATRWLRCTPTFLVIGAQKCSTTSLYSFLALHPQVFMSLRKELDFFGKIENGTKAEYRMYFPMRRTVARMGVRLHPNSVEVGEASTGYLFWPAAASHARSVVPDVKIILLFRDPVDRALSHYFHNVRFGTEARPIKLAFEDAIANHEAYVDAWQASANARNFQYEEPHSSYLIRSMYSLQLENWLNYFDPAQIGCFQVDPSKGGLERAWPAILQFLSLDQQTQMPCRNDNVGNREDVSASLIDDIGAILKEDYCRFVKHLVSRGKSI